MGEDVGQENGKRWQDGGPRASDSHGTPKSVDDLETVLPDFVNSETVTGTLRLDRVSRKGGSALIKELKQLDKNHQLLNMLKKNSRYRSCRLRNLQTLVSEDKMSSGRL